MIVLLNGLSRSGKDTVAKLMVSTMNMRHVKISENLKRATSAMFGISMDELEDHRKDQPSVAFPNVTPRDILKFLGTDVGQYEINKLIPNTGRSFWVNRLIRDMNPASNYVVSDYRYPHEWAAFDTHFPNVPIIRVRVVAKYPGYKMPQKMDHSERLLACDYTIHNHNIDQLQKDVILLNETLLKF